LRVNKGVFVGVGLGIIGRKKITSIGLI